MIKPEERRKKILEFIKEKWNVQISDFLDLINIFWIDKKTIQRDLNRLVRENLIEKEWKLKFTNYKMAKSYKIFKNIDLEKYFQTSFEDREVNKTFNFDIFKILKEVDIFTKDEQEKLENLQKEFIKNISKYDSQTLINKEYERIMIEFSWKSSSIEGNTYSLLATEALLKENITDNTKTSEETKMILNHKDAFNETLLNLDIFRNLNIRDIEFIHHTLTKKLGVTSNIRKNIVWITWTKYKPLDNEFQIKEALQDMVELINSKQNFFEKAFLSLLFISYIQAFEDGNKRTARMLTNAILLAYNSIPLSYRWVDVIEYKKATILFYEINNITYFKNIFIEQFENAVKNYFN